MSVVTLGWKQLLFVFTSMIIYTAPVLSLECVVCEGIAGDASNTWSGKCYRTPQDKHFVSKCKDAHEDVCVKYYTTNSNDATLNSVRRDCGRALSVGCDIQSSYLGEVQGVCACKGDNCNAAAHVSVTGVIGVIAMSVLSVIMSS